MSSQLEEYRKQEALIKARIKLYREQLETEPDAARRGAIRLKLTNYGAVLKELREQIRHLAPPPPVQTRAARKAIETGFNGRRWREACADLTGHDVAQVDGESYVQMGTEMSDLQRWLAEGAERLTDRQRLYLDRYYNDGLTCEAIAEIYGLDKSTVSRVIRRGIARLQEWVDAKKMAGIYAGKDGVFDWVSYLQRLPVLSDRQRQLLLLVLSGQARTRRELAHKLALTDSTVSRGLSIAGAKIRALGAAGTPVSRPVIRDWPNADKYDLCLQTGMPLNFYYKFCFRGERVAGLTRYRYEIARRCQAGQSAEATAAELGISTDAARSAYREARKLPSLDGVPLPRPTRAGNTIGENLDPETYVKLQRLVTRDAGT